MGHDEDQSVDSSTSNLEIFLYTFMLNLILQRVSRADSRYFSAAPPPPIEDEDDRGIHMVLQTVSV